MRSLYFSRFLLSKIQRVSGLTARRFRCVLSRKVKKDGKQEPKCDRDPDPERVRDHAALWEAKLHVTDQSRAQYRDTCYKLARANEDLSNERNRAERDTLDMIGFLQRQDAEKEEKVGVKLAPYTS